MAGWLAGWHPLVAKTEHVNIYNSVPESRQLLLLYAIRNQTNAVLINLKQILNVI
jgi:hypothetical protein